MEESLPTGRRYYPFNHQAFRRLMQEQNVTEKQLAGVLSPVGMNPVGLHRLFREHVRSVPEGVVSTLAITFRVPFLALVDLPDGAAEYNPIISSSGRRKSTRRKPRKSK